MTKPLFSWESLDDCPSLQTVKDFLASIPDEELLASLRRNRGNGRNDYPVHVCWGCLLLQIALRHTTMAKCLDELHRNPALRRIIGIETEGQVPKKWNMSRFMTLLGTQANLSLLREVFDKMTRRLADVVPELGKHTAGDATGLSACRAGTATPLYFGQPDADHSPHANLADVTNWKVWQLKATPWKGQEYRAARRNPKLWQWVHPGKSSFNDKAFASTNVGTYAPNPWGLYDMHGNVAEWTRSPYSRYPYRVKAVAGPTDKVVVRGGSWNDRAQNARSSFRLMYRPHERVYDVGFRVICEP